MKDGWKTSEFWVIVIPLVAGLILVLKGDIDGAQWIMGSGVGGGIYAAGRSFAKAKNGKGGGA